MLLLSKMLNSSTNVNILGYMGTFFSLYDDVVHIADPNQHAINPIEGIGASNIFLSKIAIDQVEEYYETTKTSWHANLIHVRITSSLLVFKILMTILQTLSSMMDVSLLKRPSFLILAFSGFLTLSCFYVPYLYLGNEMDRVGTYSDKDKVRKRSIESSQTIFSLKKKENVFQSTPIKVLGIINIVARIGCGFVSILL